MAEYAQRAFSNGTGTSRVTTFSSTPPAGQLLVAVHYHNQGGDPTTPSGWTRVLADSEVNNRRWYVYSREADGVVNSFTFSSGTSNVGWATTLYAYDYDSTGFTPGEPVVAWGRTNSGSNTSYSAPLSGGSPAYGVAVAVGWIGSGSGHSWGGGFTQTDNVSGIFPGAEKMVSLGDPVNPSLSWSGNSMTAMHAFIVPREAPPHQDPLEYFTWDGSSLTPLDPFSLVEGA